MDLITIISFIIQTGITVGSIGVFYGTIKTELRYMKEKLDKHNSFQDRLVVVEQCTKNIIEKVDELRDEHREIHKYNEN